MAQAAACAIGDLAAGMLQSAPHSPYHRNLARIAFLAPDIQRLVLEGRQPLALTLATLMRTDLPGSWMAQRRMLGVSG